MNRNRNVIMKTVSVALCASLLAAGSMSAFAAGNIEKDENIYVNLNRDGSVAAVYVVNEFTLEEDGRITDHGDYSEVKNLTSDAELTQENGTVTVQAEKGKFYYQGNLEEAEIPWRISISYELDGQEIAPEELAGKSGALQITISVKQNEACREEFFENYLLQTTVTLDTQRCSRIQAEGATEANVGADRQLLYNIMAGTEKEIVIRADVTEFEMDGITFQGVPMSFDIDEDSLDLSELTEKTDEIKEGVEELDDGAQELLDGVTEVKDGAQELKKGTGEAKYGVNQLADGVGESLSGAAALKSGTASAVSGAQALADGADSAKAGAKELAEGANSAVSGAKELAEGADSAAEGAKELAAGAGSAKSGVQTLEGGLGSAANGARTLNEGISQLQSGISTYVEGTGTLGTGVQNYLSGVNSIAAGAAQLQDLENLGDVNTAIRTLYQAVENGDGAGTPGLSEAANSLTLGLGEIQKQVQALSESADFQQLQQLVLALQQAQAAAEELAEGASESAGMLSNCAAAIEAITGYHMQVMAGLDAQTDAVKQELLAEANTRIAEINEELAAYEADLNAKIDAGLAMVDQVNADGTYDAQAAIAKGMAEAARPQGFQVEEITEEDLTASIEMPEENAQIQAILEQLSGAAFAMSTASESFAGAAQQLGVLAQALSGNESGTANGEGGSSANLADSLNSSLSELLSVLSAAYSGAAGIESGINAIGDALGQLEASTAQLGEAAEGITALNAGLGVLQSNNSALENGIAQLNENGTLLLAGAAQAEEGADTLTSGLSELKQGANTLSSGLIDLSAGADSLFFGLTDLSTGTDSLFSGLTDLSTGADELFSGLTELNTGTDTLTSGLGAIDSGTASLKGGLKTLENGTLDLADGLRTLDNGAGELFAGMQQLEEGVQELKDGTAEFREATDDIDVQIEDQMDEVIAQISGEDFVPVSFVSDANEEIGLVQFAIKTEGIK